MSGIYLAASETPLSKNPARAYFIAMGVYWMGFGLITILYPPLMDLFQTAEGVEAGTEFSDHVWMHGGFDILSLTGESKQSLAPCVLLPLWEHTVGRWVGQAPAVRRTPKG